MSSLVAIAYPDRDTAERVRAQLVQASKEQLVSLEDAVIVTRDADGKVKLHQGVSLAGVGAASGALWGSLIGLLFLAPFLGMAVGAASGAVGGKLTDIGVDDDFMKNLGAKLGPGNAALIVLGSTGAADKLLERIRDYGGEVIQTSLTSDAEERLRDALGQPASTA
jgi:uncharacterized membrane protein